MASGAAPALEPKISEQNASEQVAPAKPATLGERILRKLQQIFQHNEDIGVTREF